MTATLLPSPRATFFDSNGNCLVGGLVHTYVPGGTTPATTYQDTAQTIPNSNPIVLDGNGSCLIYGSGSYQITTTDSAGNAIPAYSGATQSPALSASISAAMLPVTSASTLTNARTAFGISAALQPFVGNASLGGALDVLTASTAITMPASGHFYSNSGGKINRMQDRLFLGAATVNDGANPNVVQDWASVAIPGGLITSVAQFASINTIGGIGGLFATRASDATLTMLNSESCIGLMVLTVNDVTSNTGALAAYLEIQHKHPQAFSIGLEIDSVNQSGTVTQINPYSQLLTPTFQSNIHLGAGGARAGVVDSSAAITIVGNGAKFDKGIVFFDATITSTEIIAAPRNSSIQWWGGATAPTMFLQCTGATANFGLSMNDTAIFIGNSPLSGGVNSAAGLAVIHAGNVINYLGVTGGVTGAPPTLVATGTDTNIDMLIAGKGTGTLILGGALTSAATAGASSALPATPSQYLTVKANNTGLTYKIPLYNT